MKSCRRYLAHSRGQRALGRACTGAPRSLATIGDKTVRTVERLRMAQRPQTPLGRRHRALRKRSGHRLRAYIGSDFKKELPTPFDQEYMRALFDYGYQRAVRGYEWAHKPPDKQHVDEEE